jgi:signal peptidase I
VLVANRNKAVESGSIIVIDGVKKINGKNDEYVWLIKRAIAFEGDNVRIDDGKVYVNGNPIDEYYLDEGMVTTDFNGKYSSSQGVTLGQDEIFFLGDNRKESADSRTYGTCKEKDVVGVIEEWSLSLRWLTGSFHKIGMLLRGKSV